MKVTITETITGMLIKTTPAALDGGQKHTTLDIKLPQEQQCVLQQLIEEILLHKEVYQEMHTWHMMPVMTSLLKAKLLRITKVETSKEWEILISMAINLTLGEIKGEGHSIRSKYNIKDEDILVAVTGDKNGFIIETAINRAKETDGSLIAFLELNNEYENLYVPHDIYREADVILIVIAEGAMLKKPSPLWEHIKAIELGGHKEKMLIVPDSKEKNQANYLIERIKAIHQDQKRLKKEFMIDDLVEQKIELDGIVDSFTEGYIEKLLEKRDAILNEVIEKGVSDFSEWLHRELEEICDNANQLKEARKDWVRAQMVADVQQKLTAMAATLCATEAFKRGGIK